VTKTTILDLLWLLFTDLSSVVCSRTQAGESCSRVRWRQNSAVKCSERHRLTRRPPCRQARQQRRTDLLRMLATDLSPDVSSELDLNVVCADFGSALRSNSSSSEDGTWCQRAAQWTRLRLPCENTPRWFHTCLEQWVLLYGVMARFVRF
jgi:hypothetical protein